MNIVDFFKSNNLSEAVVPTFSQKKYYKNPDGSATSIPTTWIPLSKRVGDQEVLFLSRNMAEAYHDKTLSIADAMISEYEGNFYVVKPAAVSTGEVVYLW